MFYGWVLPQQCQAATITNLNVAAGSLAGDTRRLSTNGQEQKINLGTSITKLWKGGLPCRQKAVSPVKRFAKACYGSLHCGCSDSSGRRYSHCRSISWSSQQCITSMGTSFVPEPRTKSVKT